MPTMTLSFDDERSVGAGLTLLGIAVHGLPQFLTRFSVESDHRRIGLLHDDFAFSVRTPRLTVSQHITGITEGSCFGLYFQMILFSSFKSKAKTMFGNGV